MLLLLLAGAFAAWLVSMATRPEPIPPVERVGFAGIIQGQTTVFVTSFGANTNGGAVMQKWLDAGSNSVALIITNHHPFVMGIGPIAVFKEKRGVQQETPLTDAMMGFLAFGQGQVATVHVAVLPHQGPWKVKIEYFEIQRASSLNSILEMLHLDREPDGGYMESDWIEP